MNIQRINTRQDSRFSQEALNQHGCFLADGIPYEVEIISESEAIIRGAHPEAYPEVIEEFRFYTPHITCFYDESHKAVKEFPPAQLFPVKLEQIQPSQFYVDEEKVAAVSSFIHKADDIVIQALPCQDRYISLDGHTRLYYAAMQGWTSVRAIVEASDDWIYDFVEEAQKRGIYTPNNMILVSHKEYKEKWNDFCSHYFSQQEES